MVLIFQLKGSYLLGSWAQGHGAGSVPAPCPRLPPAQVSHRALAGSCPPSGPENALAAAALSPFCLAQRCGHVPHLTWRGRSFLGKFGTRAEGESHAQGPQRTGQS